jgi:signal transduction histidine kinase
MFYIGSVLLSLAVVQFVMAAVVASFWRMRVHAAGLPEMAAGMTIGSIGALLVGYGASNTNPYVAYIGIQCFVVAILLSARAMRRLQEHAPFHVMEAAALLSCVAADAYFIFVEKNLSAVTIVHSVTYTVICAVTARHLFAETRQALKPGCRVLGFMFTAFAAASIVRAAVRLVVDIPFPVNTEGVSIDFVYALIGIAISIGWSLGFLWASYSVTEYRLRAVNDKLKRFSGAVAHDLNTPLNAIIGYLEAIDHLPDNAQAKKVEFIAAAREGALRMNGFIHHLLEQSRTEHAAATPQEVDTRACITAALEPLQTRLAAASADVSIAAVHNVLASPFEMTRVFQNLFDNAIKYRADERPLRIKVLSTSQNGRVSLLISDNGIGIRATDHEKIFLQFERAEGTKAIAGYGLGLSECRRIVESFNGTIHVNSSPGNGSTFVITLPSA